MLYSGVSGNPNIISSYQLSTPGDFSSAGFIAETDLLLDNDLTGDASAFTFTNNFTKLFVSDLIPESNHSIISFNVGGAAFDYLENSTEIIADIDANDGNNGANDTSVTYSLSGTDAALFTINPNGEVSFIASPDFENPADNDGDNTYTFTLTADDGAVNNNSTSIILTITVTDVDEIEPSGYLVSIDQNIINLDNENAVSFTFSNAEVGTTYEYEFTSSEGGTTVSGTGTITNATEQITAIDLASLTNGTITLSVRLIDDAGNEGAFVTDSKTKDDSEAPSFCTIDFTDDSCNGLCGTPEADRETELDKVLRPVLLDH